MVLAAVCAAGRSGTQTGPATTVPLERPAGVAFDAAGNLYIAETNNQVIRKVDATGAMTTVAGTGVQGFGGDGGPAVAGAAGFAERGGGGCGGEYLYCGRA